MSPYHQHGHARSEEYLTTLPDWFRGGKCLGLVCRAIVLPGKDLGQELRSSGVISRFLSTPWYTS